MSFTSFLSDPIATRDRGEWLVEFYLKNPSGLEQILRFSYRGTSTGASAITIGTDTIPAHTAFRMRVISLPTVSQSLWQSGRILSRSTPSFGSLTLTNEDGGLDLYSPEYGWQWSGCRCKIFFCDYSNIQSTIGKTFDGYLGSPGFSLPEVEIPLKGNEHLFEVPISERVYRGTSYMLEMSGSSLVSYGTPSAVNLTGDMTLEFWLWIEALPTIDRRVWGWVDSTTVPWRFGLLTTGGLVVGRSIGGVVENVLSSSTLLTLRFYHISVVFSGRSVTYYIYGDGTQITTIESYPTAFSSTSFQSFVGGGYRLRTDSDASLKVWFDEMRVWNYARSREEIEKDRFKPLSSSIPATCVHRAAMDEASGSTIVDSSSTGANGTITGAVTWLWAHEGGSELAGTPKPDVWGERWGIAPVLVDPVRQGYQVAGGGPINDLTSYEGGLSHSMLASSASFRAYITTTPSAGQSLRYLPRGLFKLGSQPTLPISALVKGYNGGSLGYVNTGSTIVRDIVTRRGPQLSDPSELDTTSFSDYASSNPAIIGVYIPRPKESNISSILDSIMVSGSGWWGYVKSSTLFKIKKYAGASFVSDYSFSEKNTISVSPLPPVAVIYQVIVRFRENNVVLREDQVAATVKSTLNWQQWTEQWQQTSKTDDDIREQYPGNSSVPITFDTNLQYVADAESLVGYLLSLLKGVKLGWSVVATNKGLPVSIDQTVTESITINGINRLGLDGGIEYSVLTTVDNPQDGTSKLELWGSMVALP